MSEAQEKIPAGNPDNMSLQGCLDKIEEKNAEIARLNVTLSMQREALDAIDDHGRSLSFVETLKAMKEEVKIANGLLTHLRRENKNLRTWLIELADLATSHGIQLNAAHTGAVTLAREALGKA